MTDVMGDLSASDAGFEAAMNMALGLMPEAPGQQASDGRVGGPGQVQGGPGPGHSPQGGAGPGQHGHGGQDGTWYTGAGAMDAQGGIYGF